MFEDERTLKVGDEVSILVENEPGIMLESRKGTKGMVGKIVKVDASDQPYFVIFPDNNKQWYKREWVSEAPVTNKEDEKDSKSAQDTKQNEDESKEEERKSKDVQHANEAVDMVIASSMEPSAGTVCARAGCFNSPSGTSVFCSLECMEPDTDSPPVHIAIAPIDESMFEDFGETFAPSVNCSSLPIVVFTDDISEQHIWQSSWSYGSSGSVSGPRVVEGRVRRPCNPPNVVASNPVVMSCAYLGFSIEPYEERYLHYKGVGMIFSRPCGGQFMQPSIDTLVVCQGLDIFFAGAISEGRSFPRIIDVGAGSGFIGKFAGARGPGVREVCLAEYDPAGKTFYQTPQFGCSNVPNVTWDFREGDACPILEKDPNYDLIISNPPYIPTLAEASDAEEVSHNMNFWEGCGLLVFLIELMEQRKYAKDAHLVVAVTSLTLKSRQVLKMLKEASSKGIRVRILLEREIAWKAWYAGRGSPEHLKASEAERTERQQVGECSYFVGYTEPGESRTHGDKTGLYGYHWHVEYVLDIYRPT